MYSGPVRFRRAIAHPLAALGDDGLPRRHAQHPLASFDMQDAAEDDREFVKLRRLSRLAPAARALHSCDTERRGRGVDEANELLDHFRRLTMRVDAPGLGNYADHFRLTSSIEV